MSRSYGQYCGLARALDVIGDRWSLLIIRELLRGPARYGDLCEGLPGIATNLLSNRLRDLESAGVVERRPAADSNAIAYALTEWGAGLREPIEGLVRWSTPLMVSGPEADAFRADWLTVALPALLRPVVEPSDAVVVGVTVDDQTFQIAAGADGVDVRPHDGRDLAATLHADGMTVLGLAAGVLDLDEIRAMIDIEGNESAIRLAFGTPRAQS